MQIFKYSSLTSATQLDFTLGPVGIGGQSCTECQPANTNACYRKRLLSQGLQGGETEIPGGKLISSRGAIKTRRGSPTKIPVPLAKKGCVSRTTDWLA